MDMKVAECHGFTENSDIQIKEEFNDTELNSSEFSNVNAIVEQHGNDNSCLEISKTEFFGSDFNDKNNASLENNPETIAAVESGGTVMQSLELNTEYCSVMLPSVYVEDTESLDLNSELTLNTQTGDKIDPSFEEAGSNAELTQSQLLL
ncbi:hypothetical protein DPMN_132176 [Dreissena polymorpha]|uniref:Uncharacterized protein n=1 Tax=Dreissena polymorpha TaxID=45954 RepID=A0A9D4FR32_DREPO|nr:hypothetical protein DPMN_132176 [Dreissena polymorpha]